MGKTLEEVKAVLMPIVARYGGSIQGATIVADVLETIERLYEKREV